MKKFILIIILLAGLSSCGIYRQNVINAPLFQEKGQTQISGHKSFNGLEGQLAFAPTNHIAILANYCDLGEYKTSGNNYIDRHNFKEIGAGLYKTTAKGNIHEIFLLVGNGMTSHSAQNADPAGVFLSQKVNYNRYLIQADFGNKQDKFEFAFSPRLLGVHYYNIVDNTRNDYKDLSNFHIYGEGALTVRYNILKFLKISGQACTTVPLIRTGAGYNYYYDFSPFNISIGLIFNLDLIKSNK
jgi:hypothetical protein